MSRAFYTVNAALWTFVSAAPWQTASYAHSIWDAVFLAAAVFFGICAISSNKLGSEK
jgi:hypothetical protein